MEAPAAPAYGTFGITVILVIIGGIVTLDMKMLISQIKNMMVKNLKHGYKKWRKARQKESTQLQL